MHGSVLQNDKYIDYANDNCVDVISEGDVEKGMNDPKDTHNGTYDGKDAEGKAVKYLKEFPGMTAADLIALNGSPAGQYNKTGKIPYTSIVDPYTQAEIKGMSGSQSVKGLMQAIDEAKAQINKEHGPSVRRSTVTKIDAAVKSIEASLAKDGAAKALADLRKLQAGVEKEPEAIKAKVAACEEKVLEAAGKSLDDAEAKIAAGDLKGAKSVLSPLVGPLKGSPLEARVKELVEKTKPEPAPAK